MEESTENTLNEKEDKDVIGHLTKETPSPKLRSHAKSPRNVGTMEKPDGQGKHTGGCERSISMQLHLDGVVIDDVLFQTDGRDFTIACASMATELVRGKPLSHALTITRNQIEAKLGGLPEEYRHCADLAANALRTAAKNALETLDESFKQMYLD